MTLPAEATEYIDYFPLAQYIQYGFNLDALILLGATLKTAKYLQLFQEDHMIARVFSFAASDLGFVLALYALLYAAFVILAQQIFGPSHFLDRDIFARSLASLREAPPDDILEGWCEAVGMD